jgi:hypothetical protein
MKKLFDFIDEAYYINLDHRTDKKEIIENHFNEMGIGQFVKRKKAFFPSDLGYPQLENGKYEALAYGKCCMYSHIEVIKEAKQKGFKNVLIFEDDAKFYTDGGYSPIKVITEAIEQLKKIPNWELFYLGTDPGTTFNEFDQVNRNLVKTIEAIGTHAVLVNHTIFDKIINEYIYHNAIDIYLTTTYRQKYLAYPMAVTQRCGITNDIGPHNYDGMCEEYWLDKYNKKLNKLF